MKWDLKSSSKLLEVMWKSLHASTSGGSWLDGLGLPVCAR